MAGCPRQTAAGPWCLALLLFCPSGEDISSLFSADLQVLARVRPTSGARPFIGSAVDTVGPYDIR
jgi:hypothetical protein